VEWNIGEAAGMLAAFALGERIPPAAVREESRTLGRFQRRLLEEGLPLAWVTGTGVGDARFVSDQLKFMMDAVREGVLP
jgi:hypothetical protein